ncbi:hypothetical protein M758_10G009800 [Ceratodon purpureus]|nr:hypothetical protein M758_10G009800 [Ceratodon purpureus]
MMDLFVASKLWRTLLVLCVVLVGLQTVVATDDLRHASQRDRDWPNHGGPGLTNHREAFRERKIDQKSVRGFGKKWEFICGADVTATPAVSKGVVYFPSYNGNLYAVSATTGKLVWEKNLTQLTAGIPEIDGKDFVAKLFNLSLYSRSTPVVVGGLLLIGLSSPGVVIAVKKSSGTLVWSSLLDAHPYAIVTMSGTAFEGHYYIGTSSLEETREVGCCTFIGAVYKLELATGKIVWRVGMAPDNGGKAGLYAGNAVWASSPPIDKSRRMVYIATGNSYSTPPEVTECRLNNSMKMTNPSLEDPCVAKDDYSTAVVAIHLDTGKVSWGKNLGGSDVFVFACIGNPASPNCPGSPGEDYDFGESPMLLTIHPEDAPSRDIVVLGQKSGFVWALDRDSGEQVWVTVAGPGGNLGGSSWGMTTDGKRVFTNILNNGRVDFTLLPSSEVVRRGGWVAMDAATGKILWSTANPDNFTTNPR